MKKLVRKFGGGEGFTLIEMLIVVAIIAILVAVSIPVVKSTLEKAKHATDDANARAAAALATVKYLSEDADFTAGTTYYYAIGTGSTGILTDTNADGADYKIYKSQCTDSADGGKGPDKVISVVVDATTGVTTVAWE